MSVLVVLAAGGSGSRMGSVRNKIFLSLSGKTILQRSVESFHGLIDKMVIVCRKADEKEVQQILSSCRISFPVLFSYGGETRQESVLNGLNALNALENDIVLVHDAARCLISADLIKSIISSCSVHGSGLPVIPAVSTMKYCRNDLVYGTADRTDLYEVQTPQGFLYGPLLRSSEQAVHDHLVATDEASVMEHSGFSIHIVKGEKTNLKITHPEDLHIAELYLSQAVPEFRVGMGYDVHRLTENRRLILCGVEIPYHLGLLGHSDADVGLHALMDALLGAASLGDIGNHFPDSASEFKDIDSLILLRRTWDIVSAAGYRFINADITIVAQQPKISPYIQRMKEKISDTLKIDISQISIKATTTEKLGFEGRMEGISAQAVCLLRRQLL